MTKLPLWSAPLRVPRGTIGLSIGRNAKGKQPRQCIYNQEYHTSGLLHRKTLLYTHHLYFKMPFLCEGTSPSEYHGPLSGCIHTRARARKNTRTHARTHARTHSLPINYKIRLDDAVGISYILNMEDGNSFLF